MIRGRLHRHRDGGDHERADGDVVEIEPGALAGVFAAPRWLRDLGWMSWLLVGVAAFIAGAVWLLALTQTIVLPGDRGRDPGGGALARDGLARAPPRRARARHGRSCS